MYKVIVVMVQFILCCVVHYVENVLTVHCRLRLCSRLEGELLNSRNRMLKRQTFPPQAAVLFIVRMSTTYKVQARSSNCLPEFLPMNLTTYTFLCNSYGPLELNCRFVARWLTKILLSL